MRSGFDPEDFFVRPRFVGVVDEWKDFSSGDGTLSPPDAAIPRCWPEKQLSPRAGSMSPTQSAIRRRGAGRTHRAGQY